MPLRSSFLSRFAISAFGLAAVGVALGGLALANTDALLERGFERAFERAAHESPIIAPRRETATGSEDFWLRKPRPDGRIVPANVKPLAAGDRITISSGGIENVLEVISVGELSGGLERIVAEQRPSRFILVTCRDPAKGGHGPLVRLLVDADGGWSTLFGTESPRVL